MHLPKILENRRLKTALISGFSLGLGIFFNYLFYNKIPGINFPIFIILVISVLLIISNVLKKQTNKKVLWLLIPLLFFSTMVAIRTSSFLTFLNIIICLILLLLIAKTLYRKKIESFLIKDYIQILFLPFKFLSPLFKTLSESFSIIKINNNKKVLSQVLRGIIISIPIVFLFGLLFSSADLIFQKHISDLITINIEPETLFRLVLILIVALVFIGAYSYIFQELKDKTVTKLKRGKPLLGKIETSVVFGSINILFLVFLLIQATYLFGGKTNISEQGFTYAEYARRGFFELITVALISLFLLFIFEKHVTRKRETHALWFKILSTSMVLQIIVIMVSAFTRLLLYEQAYGFTTLRLYSHSFIILLAIIFCLLLYKIYIDRREKRFALHVFASILLFLAGMNFLNPDLFIAKQNVGRFNTSGKLDIYYLATLSDDAIPEIMKILDALEGDMKISLGSEVYWWTQRYNNVEDWQSWNLSRARANKILEPKMTELEEYYERQEDKWEKEGF